MPNPKDQPRLIPDTPPPPNPFAEEFSQKRVPPSKLSPAQLMKRLHQINYEYALAQDTASAPVTVVPRSEKKRAAKAVRNLRQKRGRARKHLHGKLTSVANKVETRKLCDHLLQAYGEYVRTNEVDYLDAFMAIHNVHKQIILELEELMDLPPGVVHEMAVDTFAHYMKKG